MHDLEKMRHVAAGIVGCAEEIVVAEEIVETVVDFWLFSELKLQLHLFQLLEGPETRRREE